MANLQEKTEIKERFNLFQYKTVDFTLRLNIYKRKARDKTSTGLLVNTSNMLGNKSCFIDL